MADEPTPDVTDDKLEPKPDSGGQEPKTYDETYVKKLREEAASHRTRARDHEKALSELKAQMDELTASQSAAKEAELKEQGRWKEIAEQNALKLAKVEESSKELEAYKTTITGLLEGQREGLPESIIELLDQMTPVKQLEWISKHKAELVKPNGTDQKPKQQLANFNPSGGAGNAESDRERVARLTRQSGQMVSPFSSQK